MKPVDGKWLPDQCSNIVTFTGTSPCTVWNPEPWTKSSLRFLLSGSNMSKKHDIVEKILIRISKITSFWPVILRQYLC